MSTWKTSKSRPAALSRRFVELPPARGSHSAPGGRRRHNVRPHDHITMLHRERNQLPKNFGLLPYHRPARCLEKRPGRRPPTRPDSATTRVSETHARSPLHAANASPARACAPPRKGTVTSRRETSLFGGRVRETRNPSGSQNWNDSLRSPPGSTFKLRTFSLFPSTRRRQTPRCRNRSDRAPPAWPVCQSPEEALSNSECA